MNTLRCLTILKAAAERAARGGRVPKALLRLSALLLALAPPMARADGAGGGPPVRFCDGYYALRRLHLYAVGNDYPGQPPRRWHRSVPAGRLFMSDFSRSGARQRDWGQHAGLL